MTSASGARSTWRPTVRRSVPAAAQPPSVSAGSAAAPRASALGSWVTPVCNRLTTPYSWSVPISSGARAGSLAAADRNPSVSVRTCPADVMLLVLLVLAVGSPADQFTRMSPPSLYFATISAGVPTPAYSRLACAAGELTLVALSPYENG